MKSFVSFMLIILIFIETFMFGSCLKIIKNFNMTTEPVNNDYVKIVYDDLEYSPSEERLLKYLFKSYNPNIMPRVNLNESFKLYFGLALGQLINIYDKEQVMKTNVWLHMWWNDPYLQWAHIPEFDHIISIRVPYKRVWTPDIILFNKTSAHGKYDVSYKCNVVLYQQGGVLWIPPAIYKSSCQIDVKYFPFDQQICEMIFGSWVYHSDEFILDFFENMRHADLNDYVPSGTWDLIEVPASIEFYNDTTTNKSKVLMIYRIKMRRKSLFYTVNIIIPTFLISFLSVCVFYLPTDDGEKITLSLGMLFALVVFFLLIAKIIPPTSIVVPLISKYLLFTFIMNILSVLNTCVTISLYYQRLKVEELHTWVRVLLIELMPKMLFVKKRKKTKMDISLFNDVKKENNFIKSSIFRNERLEEIKSNSPLLNPKSQRKNIELQSDTENRKREYIARRKYSSHNDLILTSDDNTKIYTTITESLISRETKGSQCTEAINLSSSHLYDLEKLKKSEAINRVLQKEGQFINYYGKKWSIFEADERKSQSTKTLNKKLYSIETIKLTDRFLKVCKSVEYVASLIKTKAELDEVKEDWKYIAAVFDRLNLIIFLVVTFVGTYWSLFDAPYLFEESNQENLIKQHSHKLLKP